ncbi:MAG: DNA mismatch repair protein MutS [Candidatus Thorarchaeota archaeon]
MVKKLTPMQRQYLELKRQYPDSILMFRLGDFYEMFNEDAKIASKILDIVLTARGEGVEKWPMCGVPYHAVDSYVAKLIQAGYTVAIADQVEDPQQARGLVRREVVRLVTPGTVVEASMLEDSTNNFLVALVEHSGRVGIAAVDVSTGEFIATEFEASVADERVINELVRLSPAEVLLPDSVAKKWLINAQLEEIGARITPRNDFEFSTRAAEQLLKDHFGVATVEGFGIADWPAALGAAGAVLAYVREVHKSNAVTIDALRTYSIESHMILDATTQRNLELLRNARDGSTRGTLLSVLSKTVTPMGKRLLKRWILQPLLDIGEINRRLDAVDELARSAVVRREIAQSLRPLCDLERITSRILFGSGSARELVALREALARLPAVKQSLESCSSELLREAAESIAPLESLRDMLVRAVVDDPPVSVREGGMIRDGYSEELDALKRSISEDKKWIASLQAHERRRTGIKSLKVGYNKVFGYYIEVTKANLHMVPDDYERKQTLANAERFITPELKKREASVLAGEERINRLEYEIFESLRDAVRENASALRTNAAAVAVVDVLACLAEVAVTRRYVRPKITDGLAIKIVDGRHPSLEMILGPNEFVPNSLEIGDGGSTLIIVTGPNMAGKSTYMRQAALIVLLAQMGAFVPAKSAEIGLVDRIFTRVGAFDDLTARQSTFMVEMVETANILNSATKRSLVILDEIGRGTSTFDGMALAWAVAERIVQMQTRTLFATHFHQLTEMARMYHGVKNVHTLARETDNTIVFLHKVVDGGTDKSYGVHVAALAGVPEPVIQRAREILSRLESQNNVVLSEATGEPEESMQTTLEALTVEDPIVERIRHMDLDRTTPIEALLALKEMQEEIKRRN